MLGASVHMGHYGGPVLWKKETDAFLQRRFVAGGHLVNKAIFVRPVQRAARQLDGPAAQVRHLAGDAQHGQGFFLDFGGLFQVVNIGQRAHPLRPLAACIAERLGTAQHPAINTVRPAQPVFDLIGRVSLGRLFPQFGRAQAVGGMNQIGPAVAEAVLQGQAGEVRPFFIKVGVPAIGLHHPDDLRHGVRQ